MNIYPNPSHSDSRIDYFIPAQSDVLFEVFDVYGRKISVNIIDKVSAGNYSIRLKKLLGELNKSGVYFIRMTACGNSITQKILMNK